MALMAAAMGIAINAPMSPSSVPPISAASSTAGCRPGDQIRDDAGTPGLAAGAESGAVVSVEKTRRT
jgi:hypothetical protein